MLLFWMFETWPPSLTANQEAEGRPAAPAVPPAALALCAEFNSSASQLPSEFPDICSQRNPTD